MVSQAQTGAPHHPHEKRHSRMGEVTGRIELADGQAAEQVSVRVKGTDMGVNTAPDGSYRLQAPAGWQVLTISCLGCTPQEVTVEVKPGQSVAAQPVRLAAGEQQLREVTVTGAKSLNQRVVSASKMPIAPLDNPQSIVTIERAVLEQQQALRLSDVLANVSGVYVMGNTGGTQEEIGSRGFAYGSSNTFKNGVRFNNGIMPEVSSLERMEVLKGSAAILYGNVAAGGILNLVTKKPQFQRGGSVGLRVGSFGFVKPQFDVYGAVGQSQTVAFRLNGTYERGNSYRDGVSSNRVYVNPSLLFRLTPKTDLIIEGDYLRDRRTPDYGIGAVNYQIYDSRSRFLNTADARNATNQTSATATLTSRLSDAWQVRAVGSFQRYDNELLSAARPTANVIKPGRNYGNWQRSLQRTETAENYFLAQLDMTGTLRTGRVGHTLLVGADADQYNTNALSYLSQAYDSLNIIDPSRKLGAPKNAVSGYDALVYNTRTLGNTRRAGFYAQDLISLIDHVKVLAGVRWSYQETPSNVYNYRATVNGANNKPVLDAAGNPVLVTAVTENFRYDNAFSPRLGLVYQPLKTTSLFASYSNSFAPNSGFDEQGDALAPSLIDQYEVGIKNELFKGALSANATAYRIVNSNQAQSILPTDPRFATSRVSAPQELAGEVTSQGVEVDVQSRPVNGISLIAGYSYNTITYTKSNLYENGSRLRYAPAHTANASLFYSFANVFANSATLRGLNAGFTAYYVGDRLGGRNARLLDPATGRPWAAGTDAFQLIAVPNYFLFDASVNYTYDRFSLRFKMANLLNELSYNLHDDNSINPIAPRTFSATLGYKL
ncbi:TonB-dependent siderophore receptor [Hymenobacter monticola]|uniref:TonB-dependent receptor n=1 Tax=Hymenobacter monticola TaxID=1705399 RepID=A0ABY4AYS6_9BACT|nr:TonB-dependent siderophore receptor [Hymenobacter monticola]UOE32058.1 TonB-dependent receptor [Hymenobacter monticola]